MTNRVRIPRVSTFLLLPCASSSSSWTVSPPDAEKFRLLLERRRSIRGSFARRGRERVHEHAAELAEPLGAVEGFLLLHLDDEGRFEVVVHNNGLRVEGVAFVIVVEGLALAELIVEYREERSAGLRYMTSDSVLGPSCKVSMTLLKSLPTATWSPTASNWSPTRSPARPPLRPSVTSSTTRPKIGSGFSPKMIPMGLGTATASSSPRRPRTTSSATPSGTPGRAAASRRSAPATGRPRRSGGSETRRGSGPKSCRRVVGPGGTRPTRTGAAATTRGHRHRRPRPEDVIPAPGVGGAEAGEAVAAASRQRVPVVVPGCPVLAPQPRRGRHQQQ